MKKVLALVSSILLIGGMQSYAADTTTATTTQPSIAVVNVQQVFQQSPRIAELNKKLQNQFKTRQEKIISAQKNLQDELEKFKRDSVTFSQKDRDNSQKKIVEDQANLAKEVSSFQQDLAKEQSKIMKSVLTQLNDIISSIAKKGSYSLVLDSQAVIYVNETADITKEVSKEFDKK